MEFRWDHSYNGYDPVPLCHSKIPQACWATWTERFLQSCFSAELDVIFRGSDAINGNGIIYSISDFDHPVTSMTVSPFATQKSSSYFIGLSISEVCFFPFNSTLALLLSSFFGTFLKKISESSKKIFWNDFLETYTIFPIFPKKISKLKSSSAN